MLLEISKNGFLFSKVDFIIKIFRQTNISHIFRRSCSEIFLQIIFYARRAPARKAALMPHFCGITAGTPRRARRSAPALPFTCILTPPDFCGLYLLYASAPLSAGTVSVCDSVCRYTVLPAPYSMVIAATSVAAVSAV